MKQEIHEYQHYDHLHPELDKWPIYKFATKRKEFLDILIQDVIKYFESLPKEDVDQAIARTIYLEKQRIKTNSWKADPPNEMEYFWRIQKEYNDNLKSPDRFEANKETLLRLIKRYGQEIIGFFNIKTFQTARKISDFIFHFILFPFRYRSLFNFKTKRTENLKALRINGHCEEVRTFFNDHVVVLVPTHSSNLDSILIGYTIDVKLGLPAFAYGAGLNLFDSEFFAFFMNRLGAYKVDRRKKNLIYLQTLNSYSKLSILEGLNTIFFPGGTRSRSGELETKLKLGLLGSLVQAQRELMIHKSTKKVVVVPVVLGYESVLEARSLIIQHLRTTGQERYTARVKSAGIGSYIKFIRKMMKKPTSIVLTFGKPMDVFGNELDADCNSIDHKGKKINIQDYFLTDGRFTTDNQREMIYTRELGEQIVNQYRKYNYILPSHLVAYVAFRLLCKMNYQMEIYSVVQMPEEDFIFPKLAFTQLSDQIRSILFRKSQNQELIYPRELDGNIDDIIRKGIEALGVFHIKSVLKIDQYGRIFSQDFLALFYYSNKLSNLEIDGEIDWSKVEWNPESY